MGIRSLVLWTSASRPFDPFVSTGGALNKRCSDVAVECATLSAGYSALMISI
jgi:hypothetical protein